MPDKLHYPVADIAHVTFENAAGKFALRGYCTARKVPTDFTVESGAEVALQGANPLRFGDAFTMADYDLLVLSADAIPSTCTVTVNPERTLYFKPCDPTKGTAFTAYPWQWTGVAAKVGAFPVVLNGKGARILCRNVNSALLALLSTASGTGEILFQSDSTVNYAQHVFRGITYRSLKSDPVSIPIHTATEPELASDHSWTNKVTHRFDASDASTVTLKGEAKAGTYTLLTVPSGALADKTFALTLVNETGKAASAKLVTSDTTLSLEILSQGTVFHVR